MSHVQPTFGYARSVIALAEVLEDPENCIFSASKVVESKTETKSEPCDTVPESQKANLAHVSESQREKLQEMLDRNNDLFAKNDCDLGQTDLVKAKIDTGDHAPIKQ